ncbi:MAG: DUF5906 domain-containing protein [Methanothrix sp.]
MPRLVDIDAKKALDSFDGICENVGIRRDEGPRNEINKCKEIFEKLYFIPESGYCLINNYSDTIEKHSEIKCNNILDRHYNKGHKYPNYDKISKELIGENKIDDKSKEKYEINYENAAKFLVMAYNLEVSNDVKNIYWFDGQIYNANGENIVSNILYKKIGNDINSGNIGEIVNRIRAMLCTKPIEFDRNPFLLGVENGIIDLKTGIFRDYRADDLITDQIPIIYDPTKKCPEIIAFIDGLTPDVDDRETLLDLIVSGAIRMPIPIIANILGGGSSGSSEYFKLIDKIFGPHNSIGLSLNDIEKDDFAESEVIGKRFCLGREVEDDKGHKYSSSKLKKWSGGDKSSLRKKFNSRIDRIIFAKTIFAGNTMPRFNDRTYAFTRRLVCIKFPYRFVDNPMSGTNEKKKIVGMVDKICTPEELSGFLNIIIERIKYIIEHGQIHKKKMSFDEIDETTDSTEAFLNKFCEYDSKNTNYQYSKDLYIKYEAWVKACICNKENAKIFGTNIKAFCDGKTGQKTSRKNKDGKKESVEKYVGLSFNEAEYLAEMKLKAAITASVPPNTATHTASI